MPKPLISGLPSCGATASLRPIPDLSSRAQLCSSMKNIDRSEGCLHPHSTCILRTVNINQYYWDTVTWGTVKSLKLLGFLKNIKAGRDVSSWVSEAFPAPLKTKGDVKKNSCWAGRSSMPMQHSSSSLQAADGEQYCHLMLQHLPKKKNYFHYLVYEKITLCSSKSLVFIKCKNI